MKQLHISFQDGSIRTINVWDYQTAEGWWSELQEYFRISGYVYAKEDIVSVQESDFGAEGSKLEGRNRS